MVSSVQCLWATALIHGVSVLLGTVPSLVEVVALGIIGKLG